MRNALVIELKEEGNVPVEWRNMSGVKWD